MFCTKCGSELSNGARFCVKCGAAVTAFPAALPKDPAKTAPLPLQIPQQQAPQQQAPLQQVPLQQVPPQATKRAKQQPEMNEPQPKVFRFSAPKYGGEAILGSLESSASAALPGPIRTIVSGAKQLWNSLKAAFRNPKLLIPAFALATVWLILNILEVCGINPIPEKILSFLTFARGGMSGGVIGAIGGLIGKGIVAGAVTSLISLFTKQKTGNKRSFPEILQGAFGVSLDTLGAYLTGIGAAMLFYLFISGGETQSAFLAGAAAAYLSARAAMQNGFAKQFICSFFSKGNKAAGKGAAGFLRGLTVGFSGAALIGFSGINLILAISGLLIVNGGALLLILQATGVLKLGKGEPES